MEHVVVGMAIQNVKNSLSLLVLLEGESNA